MADKTMTLEQINNGIAWLDAKFRRHGEEEDKQCADMLRDYATLLRECEAEIPPGVEWHAEHGNFYNPISCKGMGEEFFNKWFKRRNEFPRREHKAAKAAVTDERLHELVHGVIAPNHSQPTEDGDGYYFSCDALEEFTRDVIKAFAPHLASARVPDGYTALLSDGKRYWSDKPGQHGEWFPYYLGNAAPKPEKE